MNYEFTRRKIAAEKLAKRNSLFIKIAAVGVVGLAVGGVFWYFGLEAAMNAFVLMVAVWLLLSSSKS